MCSLTINRCAFLLLASVLGRGPDRWCLQASASVSTKNPARRRVQSREESIKLVLTPQPTELRNDSKEAFLSLFNNAIEKFVGLQQSLSHGVPAVEVRSIETSVESQSFDSIFVLGLSSSRNHNRDDAKGRSRELSTGFSSGEIVTSLELRLSTAVSFESDESIDVSPEFLTEYVVDFFSKDSETGSAFVEAARNIRDENDKFPLANLIAIGVEESNLYANPYSYLDSLQKASVEATKAEATNHIDEGDDQGTLGVAVSGATSQDMSTDPQASADKKRFPYALISAAVVAGAFFGIFIVRRAAKRRKKSVKNGDHTQCAPELNDGAPVAVLQCNPYFLSPVSDMESKDFRPVSMSESTSILRGPQHDLHHHEHHQYDKKDKIGADSLQSESLSNTSMAPRADIISYPTAKRDVPQIITNDCVHVPDSCPDPISPCSNLQSKAGWTDTIYSLLGGGPAKGGRGASNDEDSKGNDVPTLLLPPKKLRKESLARQRGERDSAIPADSDNRHQTYNTATSVKSDGERSAVEKLLGQTSPPPPSWKKRTTTTPTKSDRRPNLHLHLQMSSEDLYVIPEDAASL